MSGEYPGNGAPEGWFGGGADGAGHGQAPSPEADAWRAAAPDDVTTQMPRLGGNGYGDGYGPNGDGAYGAGGAYGPGPAVAPAPAPTPPPIPAPANMWGGGFDGRQRQDSYPQEPRAQQAPAFQQTQQQTGYQQPGYQPGYPQPEYAAPSGPRGPEQPDPFAAPAPAARPRRTKLWVSAGVGVVAVVGLATLLVVDQSSSPGAAASARSTTAAPKPTPSGFQPTASTPAGQAEQTADVFLTAWQGGEFTQAASYTDDPTDAASVLSGYRTGLNLHGLQLTEKSATAAGLVTFSVTAQVSSVAAVAEGATAAPTASSTAGATSTATASAATTSASGTWTYTSHLTAYKKDGGWYVKWDPTLVAPNVTDSTHPVALAIKPGAKSVTDADGDSLAASTQPALQNIAALIKKNAATTEGTAGLEIVLENAKGEIVSGSASELTKPVSTATVKTTIDPTLESLAVTAVGQLKRSSMVVLRPSTGAILAVANSAGTSDVALTGTLAPGSSMKVVSTTSLLLNGMLPQGINTPVGCPLVETVQGVKIHNSTDSPNSLSGTEDFEPPTTPFSTDFSMSCNNAFTQWWQQMAGGKLASTALNYYGLNQPWDLGLGSSGTYFTMPSDQSGSELAEELYGQGVIEANPLSMASVAATVDTGQFHQPYLVAGLTDLKTATPLPSSVKSQLYTVMREVVTSGTAAGVGFGSGVYGKTGTAEADANKDKNPNGWMIVFDPAKDIAVAAVVVDSNFGASTAGPEVNYVLQHY